MRNTLIALFETPVPKTDLVGQELLTRVLAVKPIDFERPLIDVEANVHLSGLSRPHVASYCVASYWVCLLLCWRPRRGTVHVCALSPIPSRPQDSY